MKKLLLLIIISVMALTLSGCVKIKKTTPISTDGGIYKSVDAGENWHQKVFISRTKEGVRTIGDLSTYYMQFDASDNNTIYLTTQGNGIYKTIDAAETWSATSLSSGTYPSIVYDPTDAEIVYVAKGRTIIKSTDGMNTWDTIYVEQRANQTINSLAIDPINTNKIYAVTQTSLLQSSDFGNTWKVLKWLENNKYKLYISNKDSNILYLVTKSNGLMKSVDSGLNWHSLNKDISKPASAKKINFLYFNPAGDLMLIATGAGIYKSTNGGENWTAINTITKGLAPATAIINPQNQNEIYYTIKNILYKSVDGGTTWKTLNTIPTSRIINFLLIDHQNPSTLYLGTA